MDFRSGGFGGFSRLALSQAIAFAVHLEDVDVVGQPVEERPGQALGAEGFRPFIEGQVARDQRGSALVALRDQFKEQLGPSFGERDEAQFVDDQQLGVGHLFLDPQQATLVARLHQFVDQGRGGGEADRHPFLAGREPQAEGDVGFAGAAWAKGDHVLAPFDPVAARQLQHLHLVELGNRLEVEALEAFGGRELGCLDAALDHPSLAIDQLQFDQARQELDMVQALGGALARHLLILTQECRKLQPLEVMLQQDLGDMGHSAASDIRDM